MSEIPAINGLQKAHLYEQVADLLEQQILSNHEDGRRLPSEQQLAAQYQVSRPIIRESLKLLKERGLIDSKTGSGAYATRPEAQNIADVVYRIIKMDRIDYVSVFDMRTILETEAACRAARYVTDSELEKMKNLLEQLKKPQLSPEERSEYDFSFHYLISKSSRNPLLAVMTEAISAVCREIIRKAFLVQGGVDDSIVRHDRIFQTLQNHDEKAAGEAIVDHLKKSEQNYKEYLKSHPEDKLGKR